MQEVDVALLSRAQRAVAIAIGILTLSNAPSLPHLFAARGWPPGLSGGLIGVTIISTALAIWQPDEPIVAWLLVPLPILMRRELSGVTDGAYAVLGVMAFWLALTRTLQRWPNSHALAIAWRLTNLQVHVIYAAAAVAKLRVPEWRSGAALSAYGADPYFGFGHEFAGLQRFLASHHTIAGLSTWFVLLVELAAALSWWLPRARRALIVACAILLHIGIGITLGLGDFAIAMLAALTVISPEWHHRSTPLRSTLGRESIA